MVAQSDQKIQWGAGIPDSGPERMRFSVLAPSLPQSSQGA